MNKIFIPINKGKNKASIRGFWRDNNKTYYDYLKTIKKNNLSKKDLRNYCKKYNQLAMFFIKNKKAGIYDNRKNKTILNKKGDKKMKLKKDCKIKTVFGNCQIDEIFIKKTNNNNLILYGIAKKSKLKQKHEIILINLIDFKNLINIDYI